MMGGAVVAVVVVVVVFVGVFVLVDLHGLSAAAIIIDIDLVGGGGVLLLLVELVPRQEQSADGHVRRMLLLLTIRTSAAPIASVAGQAPQTGYSREGPQQRAVLRQQHPHVRGGAGVVTVFVVLVAAVAVAVVVVEGLEAVNDLVAEGHEPFQIEDQFVDARDDAAVGNHRRRRCCHRRHHRRRRPGASLQVGRYGLDDPLSVLGISRRHQERGLEGHS
mmetsp:Transcript_21077/g.60420  ORF Transcript_21077/g.60420 Transcript_21077/m.60420 type:complete len:219 (-) Transcript_21077:350-1006(-)